jgi:hypothetical protein
VGVQPLGVRMGRDLGEEGAQRHPHSV